MKTIHTLVITGALVAASTLAGQTGAPSGALPEPLALSASEWSHPLGQWHQVLTKAGPIMKEESGGFLAVRTPTDPRDGSHVIWNYFSPVELQDRQRLVLSFTVKTGEVPDRDNNFRFGLFNSGGTRLFKDTTNLNPSELADDRGITYRLATDPDKSAGNQSRYYLTEGTGNAVALTSNHGRQTQLGGHVGTGVLKNNVQRRIEMMLTRQGNELEVRVLLDGNLQDNGRRLTPPSWTFDQVAFSAVAPAFEFTISGVAVTRQQL